MRNWKDTSLTKRRGASPSPLEATVEDAPRASPEPPAMEHAVVSVSSIDRSGEGPLADSYATYEALRALCRRMMVAVSPLNRRDTFWEGKAFSDDVRALDVVAWVVGDALNDAGSAEEAYWIAQASLNHGFLRRCGADTPNTAMFTCTADAARARRRFDAQDATYRFDRLQLCPLRLRVEVHAAKSLANLHLLRRAGSPYVRGVVGGATFFESRVAEATLAPVWHEAYELGCSPGERISVQIIDRDAGKRTGSNLGAVDLGLVDDLDIAKDAGPTRWTAPAHSRCLLRAAPGDAAEDDAPRFLPLVDSTGGHGSDSATLAIRATVAPRGNDDAVRLPPALVSGDASPAASVPRAWEWDGARKWRVCARIIEAKNVQYDLSETWGLAWAMRCRIVAGENETATALVDKELPRGACEWDQSLRVDSTLNRASECCAVVVCERARSDLLDRRIAVASLPLRWLPILAAGDAEPAPAWIALERGAGGPRGCPLRARNGEVLAAVWLEAAEPEKGGALDAKGRRRRASKRQQKWARWRRGAGLGCAAAVVLLWRAFGLWRLLRWGFWLVVAAAGRLPYAAASSFCAACIIAPLALAGPEVAGWAFGYAVTTWGIGKGSKVLVGPRVTCSAIAISGWVETHKAAAEADELGGGFFKRLWKRMGCRDWALLLRVTIRHFSFGNPPGFQRAHLLRVEHVAFDVAVPLATLAALPQLLHDVVVKGELWRPTPTANDLRREALEAVGVDADESVRRNAIPALRFERIDVEGVDLNFEMHHGELNINGITRLLAEAQAFAQPSLNGPRGSFHAFPAPANGKAKAPRPNQLVVRIIRCTGMVSPGDFEKADDDGSKARPGSFDDAEAPRGYSGATFVEVHARQERCATRTAACQDGGTMWNESFRLQLTDPSTVVRIIVRGEEVAGCLALGAWVMTAKWLLAAPTYCDACAEGGVQPHPGGSGLRGWVSLRSGKLRRKRGNAGKRGPELEVDLQWVYVPGGYDAARVARRPETAMEQLAANSEESALRLGDVRAAKQMLADFPLRVDVVRVGIRRVDLHVKDLFMGKWGQAEVGSGSRDAVQIPLLDIADGALRHADDANADAAALKTRGAYESRGADVADFLERFFVQGVAPRLMRQHVFSQSILQTASALAKQVSLSDMFSWGSTAPTAGDAGPADARNGRGRSIPPQPAGRSATPPPQPLPPRAPRSPRAAESTLVASESPARQGADADASPPPPPGGASPILDVRDILGLDDEAGPSSALSDEAGSSRSLGARVARRLSTLTADSLLDAALAAWQHDVGEAVASHDDDYLLPNPTLAGDLDIAEAHFASSAAKIQYDALRWRTFRFELKGGTLFFCATAGEDGAQNDTSAATFRKNEASAATFRKVALRGVVAIRLEKAVGPSASKRGIFPRGPSPQPELGDSGKAARRATLTLTKLDHHVFLRLARADNATAFAQQDQRASLDDWHDAISGCLPAACRLTTHVGGLGSLAITDELQRADGWGKLRSALSKTLAVAQACQSGALQSGVASLISEATMAARPPLAVQQLLDAQPDDACHAEHNGDGDNQGTAQGADEAEAAPPAPRARPQTASVDAAGDEFLAAPDGF
ncbi:hypothetical protein M885DRAFT_456891 [Pelagophyceae sp. CCMP2097]|nr:hypothetical protein M885DRAFT_456891 [Pelagophyceae sp. CCMP2097]